MKAIPLLLLLLTFSFSSHAQPSGPEVGAPAQPDRNAADVISIFSDAYSDIEVGTFSADFDDSSIEDVTIDGNPAKKVTFTNFIAVDFQNNRQDASEMTHFHMDFWTSAADLDGKVFNSKFSHWGGTGGEVSALELNINTATDPAIVNEMWVTIDVPISDFVNTPEARDDLAQFLITSNLSEAYVDNIYLYRQTSTSIEREDPLPNSLSLAPNYPNPFNPSTTIRYTLSRGGDVSLEVFTITGQRVATLVSGMAQAGSHQVIFDASHLSSGVYTYRLQSGNQVKTRKMMLIK